MSSASGVGLEGMGALPRVQDQPLMCGHLRAQLPLWLRFVRGREDQGGLTLNSVSFRCINQAVVCSQHKIMVMVSVGKEQRRGENHNDLPITGSVLLWTYTAPHIKWVGVSNFFSL